MILLVFMYSGPPLCNGLTLQSDHLQWTLRSKTWFTIQSFIHFTVGSQLPPTDPGGDKPLNYVNASIW